MTGFEFSSLALDTLIFWGLFSTLILSSIALFIFSGKNGHLCRSDLPEALIGNAQEIENVESEPFKTSTRTIISQSQSKKALLSLDSGYDGLQIAPSVNLQIANAAQSNVDVQSAVEEVIEAEDDVVETEDLSQNFTASAELQPTEIGEPAAPNLGLNQGAQDLEKALESAYNLVAELETSSTPEPVAAKAPTIAEKAEEIALAKQNADAEPLNEAEPITSEVTMDVALPLLKPTMRENALLSDSKDMSESGTAAGKISTTPGIKDRRAFKHYIPRQHRMDRTNQSPEQLLQSSLNRMRSISRQHKMDASTSITSRDRCGSRSTFSNSRSDLSGYRSRLSDNERAAPMRNSLDRPQSNLSLTDKTTEATDASSSNKESDNQSLLAKVFLKSKAQFGPKTQEPEAPKTPQIDADSAKRGLELAKSLSKRAPTRTSRVRQATSASARLSQIRAASFDDTTLKGGQKH